MPEWIVAGLFYLLIGIPALSALSTLYLTRLVKEAVAPPVLLKLLVLEASVSLLCSSYIAALTLNTRFLGHTNPPELLPLSLVAIIAPLAMINVIAFVLWRSRR